MTEWVPLLEAAESADREMRGTFLEVCAKEHGSGSQPRFLEYFATLLNKYGSVYGILGSSGTLERVTCTETNEIVLRVDGSLMHSFTPIGRRPLWQNLQMRHQDIPVAVAKLRALAEQLTVEPAH